ncbi:MAG: transglutaminase [Gemmatimonadales bacterium]|nr:transglutaminase [Gemmatimonadales bacterium]NIN10497.1 transglutaminase [Gemmatimonadales bacterium]NIN49284.1 transglutaminase [Gemmatimonadales bacterium]NIP06748.1 transglutaminase [Gemmatimonadales bacterium]NIR02774.1 transglutaminase [Gemmatimonadales bacterium]
MGAHRSELAEYLQPTRFIDSDHPDVVEFAERVAGTEPASTEKAIALYYAVREGIRYDPYRIDLRPDAMRASAVLARGFGFCVAKATLLAAVARVHAIPSRLGFADVRNHLTTERLRRLMRTDVFAYHGYTELYLEGAWVKATPAFNSSLCERFNVAPLEFDGRHDSLFQQFDRTGNRYMEYVRDHGQFADLPLEQMLAAFEEHYPTLMSEGLYDVSGAFEDDAAAEGPGGP